MEGRKFMWEVKDNKDFLGRVLTFVGLSGQPMAIRPINMQEAHSCRQRVL